MPKSRTSRFCNRSEINSFLQSDHAIGQFMPTKTQDLRTLSDEELIKAHLQAAESDAAKNKLESTEAGCVIVEADADRRAAVAAAGLSLWITDEFHDAGKISSLLLRANQKEWTPSRVARV